MDTDIQVDIIIPTQLKNVSVLGNCLVSLAKSSLKASTRLIISYKVFVVANTTQAEMELGKKQVKILLDKELQSGDSTTIEWRCMNANTGFTGAVNAGVSFGSAPFVVLLNDDTSVAKTWLKELILEQRKSSADMVASKILSMQYMYEPIENQVIDSLGFTFLWRGMAVPITSSELVKSVVGKVDYWANTGAHFNEIEEPFGPDGASALYTRDIWERLGGMRTGFFAYLEDVDFALRARRHGARCTLASKAIVYHLKHGTSKNMSHFKVKQDMFNWWRIVLTYPLSIWFSFSLLILVERMRNFSGFAKSFIHQEK